MNVARSSSATGTTGTAEPAGGYCGRFAPSPTGPLHFGSLLAAVGSYLEARTRGGRWLVRIEDLDPPREQPGAAERILSDLDRFGFEWDGAVLRQSTRAADYDAALDRLRQLGLTLDCGCSRSQLAAMGRASHEQADELFTPPSARTRPPRARARCGCAFRTESSSSTTGASARLVPTWHRRWARSCCEDATAFTPTSWPSPSTMPNRASPTWCAARTCLPPPPRQILLQEALGLPRPGYLHLPLAVNTDGHKLSKSGDAPALDAAAPSVQLVAVLGALRQAPPTGLGRASAGEVWAWALGHWRPERFRSLMKIIPNVADTRTTGQEPVDDEQA